MEPAEYEKMYSLEETYWWFQGRKNIVLSLLDKVEVFRKGGAKVLDLGCGTGLILTLMGKKHWTVGMDFSPLSMAFSHKRGAKNLIQADAQCLPTPTDTFDLVTSLDLTEHVEHDDWMLAEVNRVLKPGGHMLLTVPAHPFLWSEHDEALYHYRRYTHKLLKQRVTQAGFEIQRLTYCISFTFPIIVGYRIFKKIFKKKNQPKTHLVVPPPWANKFLIWTVSIEAAILKKINIPFGVSLLVLAKKKTN